MLSFGGDLTVFNLIYFVSSGVDKILIGRLFGAASLGMYRQSSQLAALPASQLMYPVNNVAQSVLSRLQSDPERYRRSYSKLLTALCTVVMPVMLFLAVFARETIFVVLGEKWLPATNILWILSITSFIDPAISTVGAVLLTCGKSRKYLITGAASSLIMVASFVAGIPWGAEGVAFGHLVATYLSIVPFLWWSFKDTPITLRLFAAAVSRPLIASVLMGALLYNLKAAAIFDRALPTLMFGAALMVPLYFSFWLLIPGGHSAMTAVWEDLMSAFRESKGAS